MSVKLGSTLNIFSSCHFCLKWTCLQGVERVTDAVVIDRRKNSERISVICLRLSSANSWLVNWNR